MDGTWNSGKEWNGGETACEESTWQQEFSSSAWLYSTPRLVHSTKNMFFSGFVSRHRAKYTDICVCIITYLHKQTNQVIEREEIEYPPSVILTISTQQIWQYFLVLWKLCSSFCLLWENCWQTNTKYCRMLQKLIFKNQMNIWNSLLFYDAAVQAVLSPPATGPTWNAWWSRTAWTCWREGQRFPLVKTRVCICTYSRIVVVCVCVNVNLCV